MILIANLSMADDITKWYVVLEANWMYLWFSNQLLQNRMKSYPEFFEQDSNLSWCCQF